MRATRSYAVRATVRPRDSRRWCALRTPDMNPLPATLRPPGQPQPAGQAQRRFLPPSTSGVNGAGHRHAQASSMPGTYARGAKVMAKQGRVCPPSAIGFNGAAPGVPSPGKNRPRGAPTSRHRQQSVSTAPLAAEVHWELLPCNRFTSGLRGAPSAIGVDGACPGMHDRLKPVTMSATCFTLL